MSAFSNFAWNMDRKKILSMDQLNGAARDSVDSALTVSIEVISRDVISIVPLVTE